LPPWFVRENKFRSARYGLDATIVLDAEGNQGPVTDAIAKLLVELEPVAHRIGCAAELAGVRDIVRTGASYQRQQAVAAAHGGDLTAVVRAMLREMREGRPLPPGGGGADDPGRVLEAQAGGAGAGRVRALGHADVDDEEALPAGAGEELGVDLVVVAVHRAGREAGGAQADDEVAGLDLAARARGLRPRGGVARE